MAKVQKKTSTVTKKTTSSTKKKAITISSPVVKIQNTVPSWTNNSIAMPGYESCKLIFKNIDDNSTVTMPFVVSPSSFSDNRSAQQQFVKTTAGWFAMRAGQQLATLNLTGYMLETKDIKERQSWVVAYNKYIRDIKDSCFQYQNKYSTTLTVEGRTYVGFVQQLSLSKSAVQQFLYQYNIQFVVLSESSSYDKMKMLSDTIDDITNTTIAIPMRFGNNVVFNNSSIYVGTSVSSLLNT